MTCTKYHRKVDPYYESYLTDIEHIPADISNNTLNAIIPLPPPNVSPPPHLLPNLLHIVNPTPQPPAT
jgi:hypothetical protein